MFSINLSKVGSGCKKEKRLESGSCVRNPGRNNTNLLRNNTKLFQNNTNLSRNNTNLLRNNINLLRNNTNLLINNTFDRKRNPFVTNTTRILILM